MPIRLVMVNHDGVVMDSSDHLYRAIWDLCSEHPSFGSKAIPNFSNFLEFFRLPGDDWFHDHGFDFPADRIRTALRQAPDRAEMFSLVPPMLQRVRKETKLPLIMISAGDQPRIERQLSAGKVRHHFESVIGGVLDKTMAVSFFCSAFGVRTADTVYVGDLPADMEHGSQAGAITIGFTDDRPMMKRVLTAAGARHCVSSHEELGDLLIELARP